MKILDIEQSSDQWHEERHGSVGGTKIESAIGAGYSSVTEQWGMGGKVWALIGGKMKVIKEQTESQKRSSTSKQITLLEEIVSDRQSVLEINDYCSAEMERGNELEPLSVKAASIKHSVLFEACGMLLSDTMPWFKFSPDAIYKKDGVVVGGYETKSKMGKIHIKYQRANVVPPEHLMQCLAPMIMDDCVKWWVFGHYDDRNKVNELFTAGIKRDDYEEFITVAREQLAYFFEEVEATLKELGGEYHG